MAYAVRSYAQGRDAMLNACRGELNKSQYEFPVGSNNTVYGKEYGMDGVYWCVIFLMAMLARTGQAGAVPKTASTGAVMRWAKSVGRWRTSPEPGYFAIHVNSKGATVHIEVVEGGDGNRYQIGGNTSKGTSGSLANGIWVARNDRRSLRAKGRIIGYVAPLYGLDINALKAAQAVLGVTADGKYGPGTKKAIENYQREHGLAVDGFPGPDTLGSILNGVTPAPSPSPSPAPTPVQTTRRVAEDSKYGRETHSEFQRRAGLPVDGVLGKGDLAWFYGFFNLPVDDEVSAQIRKATDLGNGINPKVWDYHPGWPSNKPASRLVRCMEAYVGAAVDNGQWGPGLTLRNQQFMNQEPGLWTPGDKGIALQRTAHLR